MTKMSKAQRTAILKAHNTWSPAHPVDSRGIVDAYERTHAVLRRNGWTIGIRVTRAGLIAAGVDMDAIHAEALVEDVARACVVDSTDSPRARRFLRAIYVETDGRVDSVLDAIHAEALDFAEKWGYPVERSCGRAWVAEIELCPRCGLNAEAHARANAQRPIL